MRHHSRTVFLFAALLTASVHPVAAQAPTGSVSGRVTSSDGLPLPGVVVSAAAPTLQGVRTAVTSETGDYLIALLPPGTYTVSFDLDGFQPVRRIQALAAAQTPMVDASLAPASVAVSVDVVAEVSPVVTAQVASTFRQQTMSTVPSNRTLDAVLLVAPSVHPTGPRGGYTISGGQSYENLFTLNGVVINENLRGGPMTPYVEDAIEEVTVSSAGVSAEFGRFAGGVVNAVTKSGGNTMGASFRTSFTNDNWRSLTPFETTELALKPTMKRSDFALDKTVPTYEATFGGAVSRDRLWFFSALRSQKQEFRRTLAGTGIPYTRTIDEGRYEGKLTYTPKSGHSVQGSYFRLNLNTDNYHSPSFNVADLRSLTPQGQPQNLVSVQYTGVWTPNLYVSARYSARQFAITNYGAPSRDDIEGTLVLDVRNAFRYWSPTFCAVCEGDEERNNENILVKASYFASSGRAGSHHVVFGYDGYNDQIIANTHVSGSDKRIRGTTSYIRGTEIYPVFVPGTTTYDETPLAGVSEGSNLRMHSGFVNDNWRVNDTVSLNLGLRIDKNSAKDADQKVVGDDLSWSPRVAAVWNPFGSINWSVTGSAARYTMALTSNVAASTARAGNAATYRWVYTGPAINGAVNDATPVDQLVTTPQAIEQVLAWKRGLGAQAPALAIVPGVNMTMPEPLSSPYVFEYAAGIGRALGHRGSVRADVIYRDFRNFYSLRTDLDTGRTTGDLILDMNVVENTNRTERTYVGLSLQGGYDFGSRLTVGGNYALSQASGNLDGETVNAGPSGASVNSYPEYRVASWNYPTGDLAIDQRHRARVWGIYNLPVRSNDTLALSVMQQFASGVPYAAIGLINPGSFMPNPGYVSPPPQLEYYFKGRNPFRTESTHRTDLAVNYLHRLGRIGDVRPELFARGELLNVFNMFQLCGCGDSVFRDGSAVDATTISQAVVVRQPFNPYTETPVEGTHYTLSPTFGQAVNSLAWTTPRVFRFSLGLRF